MLTKDSIRYWKLILYQIIFSLNSILAWIMKTDLAIKQIEKWSVGYIKMDCAEEKCYGVLAVRTAIPQVLRCRLTVCGRFIASVLHSRSFTSFSVCHSSVSKIPGINVPPFKTGTPKVVMTSVY